MTNINRLDVVVFGATGFTGKYILLKFVNMMKYVNNIKWGIAGRNTCKMQNVLREIGEKTGGDFRDIPQFLASCDDEVSLINMASHACIIINCVGPYILYGEPVVKTCIASGTHYVDVTNEIYFIEKMKLKYNEVAVKKGVFIIYSCGLDSAVADLGALFLTKHFKGELSSVESYLEVYYSGRKYTDFINGFAMEPVMNHTSLDTLLCGLLVSKDLKELQQKKRHSENTLNEPPTLKKRPFIHKSNIVNKWCMPYFGSDEAVMNHTQQSLYVQNMRPPAQIKSYWVFRSFFGILLFLAFGALLFLISLTKYSRRIAEKYPKLVTFGVFGSDGVSEKVDQQMTFSLTLCGKGWKEKVPEPGQRHKKPLDKKMIVKVSGKSAYGTTGTVAVLSAMTILTERAKILESGGVLSPGAVFSNTSLIEKLNKHGIIFEIISEEKM